MATTVMEAPPRPRTETPVLSIRGVSKRFGAVQALHDVDFEVHAGEVVALVGDNGAGKSTLVKIIAGIHQPDTGEFYFDGEPVELDSPREASELGIATVYQDLALCDNLDVVANLFLGRELVAGGPLSLAPASSTRSRWSCARMSCSSSYRSRSRASARRSAPCRGPAPAARSRPLAPRRAEAGSARRADRRARRRADAPGSGADQALREHGLGVVVIRHTPTAWTCWRCRPPSSSWSPEACSQSR